MIRNIIGLLSIREIIFPIETKDIMVDPSSKSKNIYYLSQTLPSLDKAKRMKKIDTKQIMRYSPESVQVNLRQEVKMLFDPFRILYKNPYQNNKNLLKWCQKLRNGVGYERSHHEKCIYRRIKERGVFCSFQ